MASVKVDSSYVSINEDGTVTIDARAFEDCESEPKAKKKGKGKKDKKKGKKSLLRKVGLPIALVGGGVGAGALIMALASGKDDDYPALPDGERRDADTF